jgi:hypothetical protein
MLVVEESEQELSGSVTPHPQRALNIIITFVHLNTFAKRPRTKKGGYDIHDLHTGDEDYEGLKGL